MQTIRCQKERLCNFLQSVKQQAINISPQLKKCIYVMTLLIFKIIFILKILETSLSISHYFVPRQFECLSIASCSLFKKIFLGYAFFGYVLLFFFIFMQLAQGILFPNWAIDSTTYAPFYPVFINHALFYTLFSQLNKSLWAVNQASFLSFDYLASFHFFTELVSPIFCNVGIALLLILSLQYLFSSEERYSKFLCLCKETLNLRFLVHLIKYTLFKIVNITPFIKNLLNFFILEKQDKPLSSHAVVTET